MSRQRLPMGSRAAGSAGGRFPVQRGQPRAGYAMAQARQNMSAAHRVRRPGSWMSVLTMTNAACALLRAGRVIF
jgi:hypothetical protein